MHFVPQPMDNLRLAHLCGPLDENLRQISSALDVSIFRRGDQFVVSGHNAEKGLELLEKFYAQAKKIISIDEVQLALVEQRAASSRQRSAEMGEADNEDAPTTEKKSKNSRAKRGSKKAAMPAPELELEPSEELIESPILKTRRSDLRGRTPHQNSYLKSILEHDISFGIGPAGTGKTYLAVACAVDALERDAVKRIVLTRPAVEAGERLGFLPGDLAQKLTKMIGLRNILVHEYGKIDRKKVFKIFTGELRDLELFKKQILNFLKK